MNPLLLIALASLTNTPTPTLQPTPTTTSEIQKIREVVQEKVQEKLREITNPTTVKKGIIGKIFQIDPTQITIEYQNINKILKIDSSTVYIDLKRNKINIDKVKTGQDILAMGIYDNSNDSFQAKRIVFSDLSTVSVNKSVVVGKVVDISQTASVLTLVPSKNKNNLYQIKISKTTIFLDKNQKKIAATNLKSGHKIITILTPDPKITNTYTALKIVDLDYDPNLSPTPTKTP